MIDEELYQQANDELASQRRDLRVWAQACSLAPEDHDEARYLYTNLRVVELLAEHRGESSSEEGVRGERAPAPLEPNTAEKTGREKDALDAPASETKGSEARFHDTGAVLERATSSDGEATSDDRVPTSEEALAERHGVASTDRGRAETAGVADTAAGNESDDEDALVLELERQARELPLDGRASSAPLFAETARVAPFPDEVPTEPLEIDAGGGHEYALYRRAGSSERAVRQGGSAAATLLTLPWLLYRGLFGTALAYALFVVAVLAGLMITALAWLDAGAAATMPTRVASVVFTALALFGMIVAPWRQANRWRQEKLERRGFALVARVHAIDANSALAALERTSGTSARHAAH